MTDLHHTDTEHVTHVEMVAAGPTYRQLDHWARAGYLDVCNPHPGTGNQRRFPATELPVVATMTRLVAAGVLPEAAARIARGEPLAPGITVIVTTAPAAEPGPARAHGPRRLPQGVETVGPLLRWPGRTVDAGQLDDAEAHAHAVLTAAALLRAEYPTR